MRIRHADAGEMRGNEIEASPAPARENHCVTLGYLRDSSCSSISRGWLVKFVPLIFAEIHVVRPWNAIAVAWWNVTIISIVLVASGNAISVAWRSSVAISAVILIHSTVHSREICLSFTYEV